MTRRLLDLCCGAGGAAKGYAEAGFEVVGIDIAPQKHYPFEFIQVDAFDVLRCFNRGGWIARPIRGQYSLSHFDAVHASPLCKAHTSLARLHPDKHWPDQITPLRPLLEETGLPWVIENVEGAPLVDPIRLCGSMFDLDVRRHRLFESSGWLRNHPWPCRHKIWTKRFPPEHRALRGGQSAVVGVYGGGRYAGADALRKRAMQIDWMTWEELTQAIPPAYTRFVGEQLLAHIEGAAA